ncbi:MAG TPA: glucose 1-dehydrogenase [Candidatus Eisenbacteria bacterium]|nr:glucose 1-dehydrogenase [Candidatus Eisenbacteria bacterium]
MEPHSSIFRLDGKVALVTGGNRGIGLAVARGFVRAGARVAVGARDAARSNAAVAELRALGGEAIALPLDVRDDAGAAAAVEETVARFGALHVLVNNAGIHVRKAPQELSMDEWESVLDTNLTGAFRLSRAAHPSLKKGGGGKIVNVGSMFSIFGASYAAAYAASKGGLVQLTKSLAAAWAPDRIQVNAILPGWIDTELTAQARAQVPGLEERVVARTPAGRWGTPEDIVGAALFLASSASDFVTGVALPVDGGYSSQG